MTLAILFIVITTAYILGHKQGFKKCEDILQKALNQLMEDCKIMETYKIERYEEKEQMEWENKEILEHTGGGQKKKKKS